MTMLCGFISSAPSLYISNPISLTEENRVMLDSYVYTICEIISWIKIISIEIQVLATKCEELPLNGMMLIYLSAAGWCPRLEQLKCYHLSFMEHILFSILT
jgi:hypothetical protein